MKPKTGMDVTPTETGAAGPEPGVGPAAAGDDDTALLVLETVPDAVLVADREFRICRTNRRFDRFFDPAGNGVLGLDVETFFSGIRRRFENEHDLLRMIGQARKGSLEDFRVDVSLCNAERTRFEVHSLPILHEGRSTGRLFLFQEITDQHREISLLAEKNRELESFVYTISHDLKNPISVILGVSDLIEQQFGTAFDREGKDYLKMVKEEAERMLRLIDDILQVSRTNRGMVEKEEVDTLTILNDIVSEFQHIYRDIPAIFIIQESLPTVMAHPTMLAQVFKNLLTNSIKYFDPAKPRPIIEVGYYRKRNFHHFYVRDNGVGMSPEETSQVFDMFYRVAGSQVEGSGLGTYIVKKMVEAHGGRAWVESAKGQGTTFTFTLPGNTDTDFLEETLPPIQLSEGPTVG
ncbi:MAG: PAS domain-containing protein [Acidobacteria bacterium]|nr:PAS domain-containing protein [Acidobacteriota bacterium]